jgi:hypothetical protein
MWWQRQAKQDEPATCVVPLVVGEDRDGPLCGKTLNGGAVLIGLDGRRTPICTGHMTAVFHGIVAAVEAAALGMSERDE